MDTLLPKYFYTKYINNSNFHHAEATQLIRNANHVDWLLNDTNNPPEELQIVTKTYPGIGTYLCDTSQRSKGFN